MLVNLEEMNIFGKKQYDEQKKTNQSLAE